MIRILVPVDFSDTSKNALRYATKLFQGSKLEVTVLHIFGTQSTALMMKSIDSILIRDAEKQLAALVKDMETEAPQVTFKTRLAKNYAISTISELGNSGNYDFIVMGTKGVSGLKEVFMGSVAGGVISKTSAPVIVVPLDYKFTSLDKIVFAVGAVDISNPSTLEPLRRLVETHKSELEMLHISEDGEADLDQTLATLDDLNPIISQKKGNGDLNQHLNVHIKNNNTDLLCLLRTKKDFFNRLFGGSVTLKQTFNSPVPLLVLHN